MRGARLPLVLALAALAAAVVLSAPAGGQQATPPPCPADGSPPAAINGGAVQVSPDPAVGEIVGFSPSFTDRRPEVEGTVRWLIEQPDGTTVPWTPVQAAGEGQIGSHWRPAAPGRYAITVTHEVLGCYANSGSNQDVTESTDTVGFDVAGLVEPTRVRVSAIVSSRRGPDAHNHATLELTTSCPPHPTSTTVTSVVYYELGGRQPTRRSRHFIGTASRGCADPTAGLRRQGRVVPTHWWANAAGLDGNFTAYEGQAARVLIEIRRGPTLIGAARAIFRPTAHGERLMRDPAPCPGGCVHWTARRG